LMHYLKASVEKVSGTADKTGEKIDALMQAYLTLQGALDQKDTELKRLREGYDAHLYRRFIARFLRARHAIIDAKAHQRFDQQAFLQVEQLLDDALDDCGVESFAPEIGSDYRTANGVADPPAKTPTDTEDNAFKIAEVLELGYRLNSNGHREVIVPARVRIFVR
jgi:molecular chaperone GrpE (heat shock protein)